ncbi:hypothetical protein LshimejAT787_1700980 [Lyophyllum shimeji]|uniref:Uncharacterized protein n=1 Tax=Lyophyllum shimeji TaxID=47721 RepID=A0A9P3UVT9_LYOSH|nr:hypothetical protein LshimejAT787_1700980 [Lyophyllum shimeji]
MPMNFQDARGIDLQASPINDIAGNNNVQSSPSHNVNCGNTTNNIVSNSNNDSSVKIGGMVNRYGDMPSDLIYLASLIHGESQGARPCQPAARNHLMPWQHADSGRTRQARVTAQQNVPLEDLLQLEVEHACLESGTREEALAEWQEHRARYQEWIHAQPRRFPTHITQHTHFQSASSCYLLANLFAGS